jgi:glycosyltransferase involved in cell wall biosynthesis
MIVPSSRLDANPDRPLKVMFLITSMPIGGAETLLVNLVRQLDRRLCDPEIGCFKEPGVLGEEIGREIPVHCRLIQHKYDVGVVPRLRQLLVERRVDAVVTVGAGDKMFWGRLAARSAKVPVILSALHSTGWPDGVGRLNRLLTGITDGFIAVASGHAKFLVEAERFPRQKVFLIPNGIDTGRFVFDPDARARLRREWRLPAAAPLVGIVAALRPEKNHELFLQVAALVRRRFHDAEFLVVGDGPRREELQSLAGEMGLAGAVHFLGSRGDVPAVLSVLDLFALTSHNEASPVSILEAMSCQRPVVAPNVGSIAESVLQGQTGYVLADHDPVAMAQAWTEILCDPAKALALGRAARAHVLQHGSLTAMARGYEKLIGNIYRTKRSPRSAPAERPTHSLNETPAPV